MKHFVPLLLVSICLMLTPGAAYAQDPPDASAKADAQPSPTPAKTDAQASPAAKSTAIGPNGQTVIGLPPVPNVESFVNLGAGITPTVPSNCSAPCVLSAGRPVGAFAGVASAATQTVAGTGVDTRFAFEGGLATGFKRIHSLTLVAEFPVVFHPNGDVKSGNLSVARSYSSLFFTPALRIMYAPDRDTHRGYPAVYPWISLGGGLAHFSPSSISLSGGASGAKSSTEGALQAGAGVDIGIYRKSIALRAEVRDFYTGPPNLGVAGINLRHNVVASAGIVFRFGKKPSHDQMSPTASPAHN